MKISFTAVIMIALTVQLTTGQPATGGKGAGPRLGVITRVEVAIDSRQELTRLTQAGYDVAGVQGNRVLLYADAEELAALRTEGWKLKILEWPTPPTGPVPQALGEYNNYTNMTAMLDDYAATYPSICRRTSLGKSVRGRELWAMKITRNPDLEEDKPEVKFVSTMHGNEYEATEVSLYFIDLLLKGYATNDARIVNLVNQLEIWVVPLMNPDGRESRPASRYNANGYDLNRLFPNGATVGQWLGNPLYGPPMKTNGLQPEVRHVMTWAAAHSFTLAAELHTGATLVNYGYGDDGVGDVYSPAPDDAISYQLARSYATNNPVMWAYKDVPSHITNGISRGAEWYAAPGCMSDWGYRYGGSIELCMELTMYQAGLPASQLPTLWSQNRESLLVFLEWASRGVGGLVRDAVTGRPVAAAVRVEGIHHLMFSDPDVGDYHRILLPGTYTLWFYAPGYVPQRVPDVTVGPGDATRLDIALQPVSPRFAAEINFQPATTIVPTGYLLDSGAAFGPRDGGYTYGWEAELGLLNLVARKSGRSQDLRYDTFCRMQGGTNHVWEIEVPNGPYSVLLGVGDPLARTNRYQLYAEDLLLLDGTVQITNNFDPNRWLESLGSVLVTDGRLTISNGPDATNNLLAFVEISALEPATIEQWRARYFATTANAGDAASDADPDGDGLPNLLEYAFGLDPTQADPAGQLVPVVLRQDGEDWFACEFLRNTNATDLTFRIQATSDLSAPDWSEVASYRSHSGWSGPGRVVETATSPNQARVRVFDLQSIGSQGSRMVRLQVSCP